MAQTLPDAIIVIDTAGNITYISPITLHFYGYAHEDEVLGRNILDWVHMRHHQRALEQIAVVLAGGSLTSEEYMLLKQDGSLFYGEVSAACLRDSQGQAIGIIIIMRDITERKQAEEMRVKLEAQLHQVQKMESIGRLAGGIAHDFNNLLTVIHGYCDVIQDQLAIEDPLLVELKQIQQASDRAAALTRQLLAFSRKQILAPTVIDLNSLVTNLRTMLVRLIGEDITLDTVLAVGLRPITADPSQIEQVIMNLVVNARDAMPTGGRLTIETSNMDLDRDYASIYPEVPVGSYVMLAVTDTGCGMDAQTRARIFEPFFTTKAPGKGTGLGLATVYGIIKQSDGEITVSSEPGKGTSFKIFLPASAVAPNAWSVPQARSAIRGGSETILLAEDEETVRRMVSQGATSLRLHGSGGAPRRRGTGSFGAV